MLSELVARIFSDPNAKPIPDVERIEVPDIVSDDRSRKVAARIDATDRVVSESQDVRTATHAASVQFAQTVREMATGIIGADLMADRIGRVPRKKGS